MRKPFRGTKLKISRLLTRGLVLDMPFYEGTGSRVIDLSGNGNHGTLVGPTWTPGKDGPALVFPGTNEYINLGDPILLQPSKLTICVSFKTSSIGVSELLFRKSNGGYGVHLGTLPGVGGGAGNVSFWTYDGNFDVITSPNTYNDGIWHHVVATHDAINNNLYIDGSYIGSVAAGTIVYIGGAIAIGRDGQHLSSYFDGQISTVYIWNRALAVPEIGLLHRNPHAIFEYADTPYARVPVVAGISIPLVMQQMDQFDGGTAL